jgi:hypothetical protein
MRKIILLMLIIALISLSIGCNKISEGEVISKEHEPEETFWYLLPIVISTGKTITFIYVPMLYYDDEDFIIEIQSDDGKEHTRKLYLTQDEYNEISIGTWYKVTDETVFNDKHTKICEASSDDKTKYPKRTDLESI